MIPQNKGKIYLPFLKCAELKKGTVANIMSEFKPPESEKIKSFLIGEIECEGESYTLGMNPSTYNNLCKTLGDDTGDWIGKQIKFAGLVTLGKGKGYLWSAVL